MTARSSLERPAAAMVTQDKGFPMRTDDEIRALLSRLSRSHPSGGTVIERAAIVAEGADSAAVVTWISTTQASPRRPPTGRRSEAYMGPGSAVRSGPTRVRPRATCCLPARSTDGPCGRAELEHRS